MEKEATQHHQKPKQTNRSLTNLVNSCKELPLVTDYIFIQIQIEGGNCFIDEVHSEKKHSSAVMVLQNKTVKDREIA